MVLLNTHVLEESEQRGIRTAGRRKKSSPFEARSSPFVTASAALGVCTTYQLQLTAWAVFGVCGTHKMAAGAATSSPRDRRAFAGIPSILEP